MPKDVLFNETRLASVVLPLLATRLSLKGAMEMARIKLIDPGKANEMSRENWWDTVAGAIWQLEATPSM